MRIARHSILAALIGLSLIPAPPILHAEKSPGRPSKSITIADIDGTEVGWTLEELRELPPVTMKDCIVVGSHVGFIGVFEYSGVRLVDVLARAKAAQKAKDYKKRNMFLVLKGTDGYQVVMSWRELYGTPDGLDTLVVLDEDGEPLPVEEGRLHSYLPGDKYCGRSVKCLERIEIGVAEGVVEK